MAAKKKQKRKKYYPRTTEKIIRKEFFLTEQDQITCVYKKEGKEYIEVTNISYEIKIAETWMTIVRYDSSHRYLHRHIRISLDDIDEIIDIKIEQGGHHKWLTTAMSELRTNFIKHRRLFFERSEIEDPNNS